MAPAPPPNDFFISYCHKDDQPFGDGAKRWVSDFYRDLRTRTENYLGRAVTAWWDAKLSGADVFSDEIEGQLRASAVLVSVLSPSYLASEWCRREVDVFEAGVSGGVRVGTGLRVVKVLKTPVPRADLQRALPLMDTVLGSSPAKSERGGVEGVRRRGSVPEDMPGAPLTAPMTTGTIRVVSCMIGTNVLQWCP